MYNDNFLHFIRAELHKCKKLQNWNKIDVYEKELS